MSDLTRRHVLAGAAATVAAAALPVVAVAGVVDPTIETARTMFESLLNTLLDDDCALVRMPDGGGVLFWLRNQADLTSLEIMSLEDAASPDVATMLNSRIVDAFKMCLAQT
jgi:hypothetical protein